MIKAIAKQFVNMPLKQKCQTKECKKRVAIWFNRDGIRGYYEYYCEECAENIKTQIKNEELQILQDLSKLLNIRISPKIDAEIDYNMYVEDKRYEYRSLHEKVLKNKCLWCENKATYDIFNMYINCEYEFACDEHIINVREKEKNTVRFMLKDLLKKYGYEEVPNLVYEIDVDLTVSNTHGNLFPLELNELANEVAAWVDEALPIPIRKP
ncbi:hypothetical protein ACFYU8_17845 [Brevibacillus sp. NPDC003359]|uniref:hypothetical protein n=1 Tax=unclassified Brevibacillus TaxID=2684853 RepID=UPI0036BBFFF9